MLTMASSVSSFSLGSYKSIKMGIKYEKQNTPSIFRGCGVVGGRRSEGLCNSLLVDPPGHHGDFLGSGERPRSPDHVLPTLMGVGFGIDWMERKRQSQH